MSKVEIRKGDYVSLDGISEDQYHAVAKAFMEAGADKGDEYGEFGYENWRFLGWGEYGYLDHQDHSSAFGGRHLTIEQVLGEEDKPQTIRDVRLEDGPQLRPESFGAIGAGCLLVEEEETPTIQSLLKKAEKHARKAQKHEDKRQEAIEQARALLPDGWELKETSVGETSSIIEQVYARGEFPKHKNINVDLNDPANWREGDVVECIDNKPSDCTKGSLYVVNTDPRRWEGRIRIKEDDDGDASRPPISSFKFHHRP